jgi:holliday junction DNA helicase RuvA
MIGYLKGQVLEAGLETALLETAGVGYELTCSANTLSALQSHLGQAAELWVHTHVREDALQLFGFVDKLEKQVFLSLLKVNGVGPKSAINILSGTTQRELMTMIESEDVRGLSKLPKVGKKTAEQIILSLKGKLVLSEAHESGAMKAPAARSAHRELSSALINLGFRAQDVDRVVGQIAKDVDLESGLKTALAALTSL